LGDNEVLDYGVFNFVSEEIYKTTSDDKDMNDIIIEPNNEENVFNGEITKIPKLILSPTQAFFKLIVNVIIVLLICKS